MGPAGVASQSCACSHGRVECINESLSSLPIGSSDGIGAVADGDCVGITLIDELIAHEFSDDGRVQGRSMLIVIANGSE